ncbi:MAG TPA: chromosome segregation protein SMC [Phycisphaerae bacterium]|nr:chromosome segregation protein SMC [Phycisphaerae bacterium]HPS53031.1 chromosome segregation protein SMC [Phycisphaerae bacterium]
MKLKKLILAGFKSFADKTEFDFDDGISCVVGPNGCGKSNVVDAVKWVLGEQSAKSLRGSEMMDVIFNGSSARKPSGRASVTLVFDNSDSVLKPVLNGATQECPEVSVTRRLFRSGQSEYLINNQPSRLRDIREMFLDTGLGANAYSIIEQGKVSAFLQAGRDERRAFFDEAAGISRYKARKKEAIRKLERVEQNLLRVMDIMAEVEKRLRSIKVQAGKARNYQTYADRLNELRALFFLSRFHTMKNQRKMQADELQSGSLSLETIEEQIAQLENAQRAVEVEAAQIQETTREIQARISNINAQMTTLHERVEMQNRRMEELVESLEVNNLRTAELAQRLEESAGDIELREVELQQVAEAAEELRQQTQAIIDAYSAAEMHIADIRREIEDRRSGMNELERQEGQLKNEAHAASLKCESLTGEKQRVADRLAELQNQIESIAGGKTELETRMTQAIAAIESGEEQLGQLTAVSEELTASELSLGHELADAREQRSRQQGRMHTLEEMQKRMVGVTEATRLVIQAKQDGKFPAIQGMLGDFIETDTEHAPLVEAALAGADQRLVAATFAEVQQISAQIEEMFSEGGSVEIICADLAGRRPVDDATVNCPQAVGRVLDFIKYEPSLEPLMWNMLGRTLMVRTLADAACALENTPAGYRFVTLAGEVLEPDGMVRVGSASHAAGMIARKSEMQEITQNLSVLDGQVEALQTRCEETRRQREQLEEQLQSVRSTLYEARFEKSESSRQIEQLTAKINALTAEQPGLAEKMEHLTSQISQASRQQATAMQQTEQVAADRVRLAESITAMETRLAESQQSIEQLNEKRTELKVAVAENEQKRLSLRDSLESIRRQREQMQAELEKARNNLELDRQRREQAEQEIASAQEEGRQLVGRLQEMQQEYNDSEESRRSLSERLVEIRQQLAENRQSEHDANRLVGNMRVKLSELDAHITDIIERAAHEMEMNLNELYGSYSHDAERDWDAVEAEINDLRTKISRLGNVNMDAISEQDELEKREEFLRTQLDDINNSRKQLEDLINRLNVESRERFVETFNAVRENFQSLFRKLFGGGKADIMLSEEEDVLESGIDIIARPPGKEPRSISLLSGGEQTMSALALMFSFFQAKPSPFTLLDEVDAALDEANNERYNAIVQEFSQTSQFIMITHSKRSMAIANVMYGVTMQELGVSKRVSVKFEEADKLDEQLQPVTSQS